MDLIALFLGALLFTQPADDAGVPSLLAFSVSDETAVVRWQGKRQLLELNSPVADVTLGAISANQVVIHQRTDSGNRTLIYEIDGYRPPWVPTTTISDTPESAGP